MTQQEIILRELELLKELRELTVKTPEKHNVEWGETNEKFINWEEAKIWCEEKDGWRMPTRTELIEAYDNKVGGFKYNYSWSATTCKPSPSDAYLVPFGYGYSTYGSKKNTSYVR